MQRVSFTHTLLLVAGWVFADMLRVVWVPGLDPVGPGSSPFCARLAILPQKLWAWIKPFQFIVP